MSTCHTLARFVDKLLLTPDSFINAPLNNPAPKPKNQKVTYEATRMIWDGRHAQDNVMSFWRPSDQVPGPDWSNARVCSQPVPLRGKKRHHKNKDEIEDYS